MTDRLDDAPEDPTLDDLVRMILRASAMGIRVAAPASVLAYNPTTQRATVQLDLLPVAEVEGEEVLQPPVQIQGVPVALLGGALNYIRAEPAPGDTGLALFTDRCLSVWLLGGGPVDPINGRTHALGDAVFVPGVRHAANLLPPPTIPGATVVEGPVVQLGASATQAVALASALHTYISAMIAAAVIVPADGGASMKTSMLTYLTSNPFATFATTKTVAE